MNMPTGRSLNRGEPFRPFFWVDGQFRVRAWPDVGAIDVREALDHGARSNRAILEHRRSLDTRARANLDGTQELHADADDGIATDLRSRAQEHARGVAKSHAFELVPAHESLAVGSLGLGKLDARVDAAHLARIFDDVGTSAARSRCERHHVRQVELALIVVGGQSAYRAAQQRLVDDVHAGIDLVDVELGGRGIAMLDDTLDPRAGRRAHDASVARWIGHPRREHGQRSPSFGLLERSERRRLEHGHVAAENQHATLELGNRRETDARSVARAQRLVLGRKDERRLGKPRDEQLAHARPVGIDDDDDWTAAPRDRELHHVHDQRLVAHGMQHLRQRRSHALTLSGSENQRGGLHLWGGCSGVGFTVSSKRIGWDDRIVLSSARPTHVS